MDVLTVDTQSPAWLDEWDRLFLATPKKKVWEKQELQRKPGESDYKYSYRLLYSRLVGSGQRELGQRISKLGIDSTGYITLRDIGYFDEEWLAGRILQHFLEAINYAKEKGGFDLGRKYAHYSPEAFTAQVTGMSKRAARWALANFDADTYRMLQVRGRRGGKKGGVATKYSLEQFLETAGMNVAQAARHLGCTRQTIYNLQERYGLNQATGEVHE